MTNEELEYRGRIIAMIDLLGEEHYDVAAEQFVGLCKGMHGTSQLLELLCDIIKVIDLRRREWIQENILNGIGSNTPSLCATHSLGLRPRRQS